MLAKTALVRKALESLYDGKATIINYPDESIDENTGIVSVSTEKSGVYPCRVSYKSLPIANTSDGLASFEQSITLFIAPDIKISSGCDIDVLMRNKTLHFTSSGVSAVYDTHQEIPLKYRGKYSG